MTIPHLQVNMILSYHPPIFVPMKRLTQSSWKERIVVRCAENRVAIYSPHTSYDAVQGGVNDWLLKLFGGKCPVWFAVYSFSFLGAKKGSTVQSSCSNCATHCSATSTALSGLAFWLQDLVNLFTGIRGVQPGKKPGLRTSTSPPPPW